MSQEARRIYAELGATPVINVIGNRTFLGGSAPSPQVVAAMEAAGRYYVDMDELLTSSGEIVAQWLECEAALVTPGCAAALVLGTAGLMTGKDPAKMEQLPDSTGMKDEIVMQKRQRYKYDRVVRMVGSRIVEAGRAEGTSAEELEAALGPDTAAVLYPVVDEGEGLLGVQEVIEIAHRHSIPVLVDAAYKVYPLEGLKQYAAWGADLVGYGAKYFGAPNSSGLLCGRADLVEAARLHSFASFEVNELMGFGRPLKIDRQEVAGVLAALREWLDMDHEAARAQASRRGEVVRAAIADLPHVEVSPAEGSAASLHVTLDETGLGKSAAQVDQELKADDPRIWVWYDSGPSLQLSFATVVDGDEAIVAQRLRAVLGG
ncbi:MAG: aminotransferase class V-fold PLP-dependent enzyme [Candidatus Latescibacteria bacterium]|nr:aminotransferase class V-fold PLP-dependent enzyme [Candidatus Latescibacterota bacterium]